MLVSHPDVDVNRLDRKNGVTALHYACQEGHVVVVRALISAPGIDVNRLDRVKGITALHWACQRGHVEVVRALLSAPGIDVNNKGNQGFPALDIAKAFKHTEIATLLVQAGACGCL